MPLPVRKANVFKSKRRPLNKSEQKLSGFHLNCAIVFLVILLGQSQVKPLCKSLEWCWRTHLKGDIWKITSYIHTPVDCVETARMKFSYPELPTQIGSASALPLLALASLMLELLQLLASLLLNLTSSALAKTTTTSTSKPWRLLTLNLEGHMDCPVCGLLLKPPSVIQSTHGKSKFLGKSCKIAVLAPSEV